MMRTTAAEVRTASYSSSVMRDKANPFSSLSEPPSGVYKFADLTETHHALRHLRSPRAVTQSVASHGRPLIEQERELNRRGLSQLVPLSRSPLQEAVLRISEDPNVINAISSSNSFSILVESLSQLVLVGDEHAAQTIRNESEGNIGGTPPPYTSESSDSSESARGPLAQITMALAAVALACPACGSPSTTAPALQRESSSLGISVDPHDGNEGALPHSCRSEKSGARQVFSAIIHIVVVVAVCSAIMSAGYKLTARALFSSCFKTFGHFFTKA